MKTFYLVFISFIGVSVAISFDGCKESFDHTTVTTCTFSYQDTFPHNLTFIFKPEPTFKSLDLYHIESSVFGDVNLIIKLLNKDEFVENSWNQVSIGIKLITYNSTPTEVVYYINNEEITFNLTSPLKQDTQLQIKLSGGWEGNRDFTLANPGPKYPRQNLNGTTLVPTSGPADDVALKTGKDHVAIFVCVLIFLFGAASFIFGLTYYLKALKIKRAESSLEVEQAEVQPMNREENLYEEQEEYNIDQTKNKNQDAEEKPLQEDTKLLHSSSLENLHGDAELDFPPPILELHQDEDALAVKT